MHTSSLLLFQEEKTQTWDEHPEVQTGGWKIFVSIWSEAQEYQRQQLAPAQHQGGGGGTVGGESGRRVRPGGGQHHRGSGHQNSLSLCARWFII